MKDSFYPIEIKLASKNGWSTPQEVPGIWGVPYARNGVTVHWWGDGTGADNHDNIVNFISNRAANGVGSTNYVLSDNKITLLVSPDNVAWCSQKGNPTTISVEHQPTLGAEGYKKSGWLLWQLEGRYNKRLQLYKHSDWFQTACPGTIDLGRIRAEADKWASGGYLPAQPPVVTPAPVTPKISISYSKLPTPINYTVNKDTNLWNFNSSTWGGVKAVKAYKKGDLVSVYGIADNHTLKAKYAMTAYSFGQADLNGSPKATNGFNMVDLDIVTSPAQPVPTPPPVQVDPPQPTEPDRNAVIAFLTGLVKSITDFLAKFKKG